MKIKKLLFAILCLALLPFTASSQFGDADGGIDGNDVNPVGPVNPLRPEDIPVPAGRRGDCKALTGPNGMLKSQTVKVGAANYVTCFGWDNYGSPAKLVDPAGFLTEFQYDLLGRPTLTKDPHGEESRVTYNANSQVQQTVQTNNFNPNNDAANRTTTFHYNSLGSFEQGQITGGDSGKRRYDADDQAKASIGPDNALGSFSVYDGLGRVEEAGVGVINDAGDPTVETLGRVRYIYDDAGRVSNVINRRGDWTRFTYDALGRLEQTTYPDSTSLFDNYDLAGRITWRELRNRVGGVLQRTNIVYDTMDRVTETQSSGPRNNNIWKTTWTYQNNGADVVIDQYANNIKFATTTKHLDAAGRLKAIDIPSAGTINSTYDVAGRLDRVEHSRHGLLSRYQYDALGRIQSVRDGLNNISGLNYNGLGDVANIYPPTGAKTVMHYDVNGRTSGSETGSISKQFHYNAAGRLIVSTYGANGVLLGPGFTYQRESGLMATSVIGQQAQINISARDLNGQPTSWSDANGVNFTQVYDNRGRPTLLTAEKNGGTQYRLISYDDAGRVKTNSESVAWPPDRYGEVTKAPGGSSQSTATKLINRWLGRPTYDSHLKSVVWFDYDSAGNVLEEQRWIAGRWLRTTTTFEAQNTGMLTTLTYPSNFKMERYTDLAGRLTIVDGRLANGGFAAQASYDYLANSPRLDKIRFGVDIRQHFTYDAAGRVITTIIKKNPLIYGEQIHARVDYKYSPAGKLIAKKELVAPTWDLEQNLINGFTAGYDDAGRLSFYSGVSAQTADAVANNAASASANADSVQRYFYNSRSDRTTTSTRDTAGGLTGSAQTGKAFVYTLRADGAHDSARQRPCWYNDQGAEGGCTANPAAVVIAFNPDAAGNIMGHLPEGATGQNYEYDLFGRLTSVLDPDGQTRRVQYNYDALGRLISRVMTERGSWVKENHYIWASGALIEVRDIVTRNSSGEPTSEIMYSYLYGTDSNDIIAAYDRRYVRYHHNHPDGSVFMLTNEGRVTQWYRYSPFGETQVIDWINNAATQRTLSDSKTLRLFGGLIFDPVTKFYFAGSWFDPVHGQSF